MKKGISILLRILVIVIIYAVILFVSAPVVLNIKEKVDNILNAESTISSLNISEEEKKEINYEELCEDIRTLCTGSGEMNAHAHDDYDREKVEEEQPNNNINRHSLEYLGRYAYEGLFSRKKYGDGYIIEKSLDSDSIGYNIYLEKEEKEIGKIEQICKTSIESVLDIFIYIIVYSIIFFIVLMIIILKKRKSHK